MIYAKKVMILQSVSLAKAIKKLAEKQKPRLEKKYRLRRSSPEIPRDPNPNFWLSPWSQLITRLASVEGGPSIGSREGKLFRRRFRVPYDAYCRLVSMCLLVS